MDALDEVGYKGDWVYEVDRGFPKTILRERAVTFADLVKNAHEIFERKKPTVFAKPKPGVGMWE